MAKLTIDIEARLAQFQDQLTGIGKTGDRTAKQLDRAFGGLRSTLATLGVGLSAGALVSFVKSGIDAADNLAKLSQKVGVSVESLSAFNFAAKLADVSTEQLSTGLRVLARNALDTQAGIGEAKDSFKALGIQVTNSAGQLKSTEELLLDIAERFAGIEDGAGKTALAMKIFGRSGAELIPLLNEGRAGFERLREEAQRLGLVISTETAKAAEQFNDDMTRLAFATDKLKFSIAESALPALNSFVTQLLEANRISGGFSETLRLFVFNLDAITSESAVQEIDRLTKKLREFQEAGAIGKFIQSPTGTIFGGREEDLKKQIEFLKVIQREEALALGVGIGRDERQRFPGTSRRAAPALPDEEGLRKAQAALEKFQNERARAAQSLAEFNDEVQRGAFDALNDQQKAFADESRKVADEITAAQQALAEFDAEVQQGVFEALNDQQRALAESGKETDKVFEDLGLTFSSAFEDAIVQAKSLRDVMKGLLEDIARILIRRSITEPFAKGISSFAGGLFGGSTSALQLSGPFASGGSFSVGGSGGTDSQTVAFRATPGERVTVRRPDQIGGGNITVVVNNQGAPLEVTGQQQRNSADGQTVIEVMVKEAFGRLAGRGQLDGIMRQFGARRPGVA